MKKTHKTVGQILALTICLLLLLSGCGGSASSSSTPAPGPQGDAVTGLTRGEVSLTGLNNVDSTVVAHSGFSRLDAAGYSYFVSDLGTGSDLWSDSGADGSVRRYTYSGKAFTFEEYVDGFSDGSSNLYRPRGLALVDNTVYIADLWQLHSCSKTWGYQCVTLDFTQIYQGLNLTERPMFDSLAPTSGYLYASDVVNETIIRVPIPLTSSSTPEVWLRNDASDSLDGLNGLLSYNDQLYIGTRNGIYYSSLSDTPQLTAFQLKNNVYIDGLAVDAKGNIFATGLDPDHRDTSTIFVFNTDETRYKRALASDETGAGLTADVDKDNIPYVMVPTMSGGTVVPFTIDYTIQE